MSLSTIDNISENQNPLSSEQFDDDAFDIQQYAKILKKHRWPIMLVTALVTALAAFVVSGMTPVYRATSTLLIETQQAMPINFDELVGIDTTNKEYYQTQFELLKSRKLARRVIEEMGIFHHPEMHNANDASLGTDSLDSTTQINSDSQTLGAEPIERQMAVNRFLRKLSVSPIRNTKLVKISFESPDPVFAAKVANKIADTYIISYLDSRMEMGEKATDWLGDKLVDLKLKLEDSQRNLLTYREQNGLIDIQGSVGKLTEQEIGIITSKLLDAEATMAHAEIVYREVEATKSRGTNALLGLPAIDSNEMVRRYKIETQQAQMTLDELSNRYGRKHPKVIDAQSRLTTSQANLRSQINNIVDTVEKKYQISKQTVASIEATLNEGKASIQKVGRSQIDLLHLEREVEMNQKMYDTFYTRIREVNEAEDMTTTNAQISEYAEAPLTPVRPKKTIIVLMTLLLSAVAAAAMAIIAESMNDSVTSTDDVESNLKLRMLGIIPLVSRRSQTKAGHSALVPGSLEDDKDSFEESIKTIRTSVCLEDLDKSNQVIMVTSALPGEGKSTLASHLAHSLSQMENVLLIECDLRRPSLHRAFKFNDNIGLAQLLMAEAKFADCIKIDVVDNLDVIPAGSIPKNPLELISSDRFNRMLEQMKKRYDRIVIDSAPVQAVSDALILGRLADTVLYTVKADATPVNISARGVKRLRDADINMCGVVVTQVNIKKIRAYGGDLDYQGYYDYYGYSETEKSETATKISHRKTTGKQKEQTEAA